MSAGDEREAATAELNGDRRLKADGRYRLRKGIDGGLIEGTTTRTDLNRGDPRGLRSKVWLRHRVTFQSGRREPKPPPEDHAALRSAMATSLALASRSRLMASLRSSSALARGSLAMI
jgi:hypothetical protein